MSTGLIDCDENGQWRRFDDDDYFKRYEKRLTGEARKTRNRKVREEQIEWKAIDDIFSQARRQPRKGSAGTQHVRSAIGLPSVLFSSQGPWSHERNGPAQPVVKNSCLRP